MRSKRNQTLGEKRSNSKKKVERMKKEGKSKTNKYKNITTTNVHAVPKWEGNG